LGADQPLAGIEAALASDHVLRRLLPRTSGIALMRQDPWECLVSYVISAFNNIPKISLSIERLARCFGTPIVGRPAAGSTDTLARPDETSSRDQWAFPAPGRLADARLVILRTCALGYRASYVRGLARLVADGEIDLDAIARMTHDGARAALLELPGVGEKVADCVLLFAFGHHEAFPVDVWVQRAVERWYFQGRRKAPRAIRAWANDRFGPLAGYAQQHLFAAARLRCAVPIRARGSDVGSPRAQMRSQRAGWPPAVK
ncbi:MAG: DNA-3-methyladenine glycosylase family protein, partial [Armatimonadota bacterium]